MLDARAKRQLFMAALNRGLGHERATRIANGLEPMPLDDVGPAGSPPPGPPAAVAARIAQAFTPAQKLEVAGQYGIGDCIHQRAVVRELMRTHKVTLHTFYTSMFHDLAANGLEVVLRTGPTPRIKDSGGRKAASRQPMPKTRIGYTPELIHAHGSILAAQFASVGLRMPEKPDFSLPVPMEWRDEARKLIAGWDTGGKPVLVYRPIVQNDVWSAPARSPDPKAYDRLYRSIRDRFFVVSVADLTQGGERIVGPKADVDVELHNGELSFEVLAGLVAEAAMLFGNPGFGPVLAQAVGTPVVCVYGANESFRTTLQPGAHLAPTLAIEPITPCEHHARTCGCDKTIDVKAALPKLAAFVDEHGWARPRVLIFAATYVDTPERLRLTRQWCDLHRALNPGCDFLLVDSQSPMWPLVSGEHVGKVELYSFPDNIGHLSRNGPGGPHTKGRDGWGRAFCYGIDYAVSRGYDFVVHIEGDSLFKLPVMPIVRQMQAEGIKAASVPVEGTKRKETNWAETGLMFFDCEFLADTGFTVRYDWPNRRERPTPERVIFDILGPNLRMMPWRAERGDKSHITPENVGELDWVTHTHDQPEIYDRFIREVLGEPAGGLKINLGCGTNRLSGWQNHDAEVDITKPLPFADGSADFMLAEHVVEHVSFEEGLTFFRECRRVLRPGGVLRVAVPSVEAVMTRADADYIAFAAKWAPTPDLRGAMHAIMFAHGHKMAWTQGLLRAALFYAGFDTVIDAEPGRSAHPELVGVEGHGKVIGEKFNAIETVVCEAT